MERLYAQCPENFYPRPPRGERPSQLSKYPECPQFLSTPSSRRATCRRENSQCHPRFLSTPSSRRATIVTDGPDDCHKISIHALLAESDCNRMSMDTHTANFYPRPPRGERRWAFTFASTASVFLSTPSSRRATNNAPAPPQFSQISIHALLAESDAGASVMFTFSRQFLSTPSSRRATSRFADSLIAWCHFYPRPPRGERPPMYGFIFWTIQFLSTPSSRRATRCRMSRTFLPQNFYPRPPRGERLQCNSGCGWALWYFYPRPPRGERRNQCRD